MSFVVFESVQKTYDGEILVVKDLNLSVDKGEFLTMLGPSGSGKTTCLMMLAGFEVATHGNIMLDGQPINHIPPHKRGIGMVFQNYALFPHLSVAENLAFPLKVRKMGKAEVQERVLKALDMVQMSEFLNRRPAQLSGGQQQRIALARALVFDPMLVLMDEPLGALDKQLREHMQYEIKHIHERLGITVVYVTHDQGEALTMSNRIAVFDDGVIQQLAAPADLYERPENAFVAGFIGENNRLLGKVQSIKGDICEVKLPEGDVIKATKINVDKVGDNTTLSLRPERISILCDDANLPKNKVDNKLSAVIEEMIYLGDHLRVRLQVAGNDEFIVKIPNDHAISGIQVGQKLAIGWRNEDCRALDA